MSKLNAGKRQQRSRLSAKLRRRERRQNMALHRQNVQVYLDEGENALEEKLESEELPRPSYVYEEGS